MASAIETKALRREFGSSVALQDLDLTIPEGAVCALVGPNGAGKTTLLRMIASLMEPTSGTAKVFGYDIREEPRRVHGTLGFLPDFFGLYEELTALECLQYFYLAYRLPEAAMGKRIAEVLGQVALLDKADLPIDSLSRGMRQRLGLARTLLHDPRLLLLDEPASGLDPGARHDLQALLKGLAAAGKTIVVSSHILSELEDYCSHVVILDKGRLIHSGSLAEDRKSKPRRFRLTALGGPAAALAALSSRPEVSAAAAAGSEVVFDLAGSDEAAAALLTSLVGAGVRLLSFGESAGTIEESYLSLMSKEIR